MGNVGIKVTLRRVHVAIVAVEKQQVLHIVSSLNYPACKAHAPYYIVICGLTSLPYFPTVSHKRHDFRKKS
jgi:hypothetical protein